MKFFYYKPKAIKNNRIKKDFNMKTKIIVSTLIIAFAFASLAGCRIGPVEIESVTVCKNVDSDYKPVDPTTTFPSGTQVIYISVKINNMTTEDKLTTKWNYLETGEEINTTDFTTDRPGSGYISFNLTISPSFSSGRYSAIVYLNNELIETAEFSVE